MIRLRSKDGVVNRWIPKVYDIKFLEAIVSSNGVYFPSVEVIIFDAPEDIFAFLLKIYPYDNNEP